MKSKNIFTKDAILILIGALFYMASPMLVTPLITGYSESVGASATIMGLVGGLMNLVSLAFQPFSGNLADRMSKYKLASIGTILMIIACVGYIISSNAYMVLLFRVVNGFGFAMCSVTFATWFAAVVPQDRVGYAMGIYGLINALAMATGPAIGIRLYKMLGYRTAFIAATAFSIICLVAVQFCSNKGLPVKKSAAGAENSKGAAAAKSAVGAAAADGTKPAAPAANSAAIPPRPHFHLVDRRVVPVAFVIACFAIPYCATQSFIVRYTENLGLNVAVSFFFTIYAVALLVSRLFISRLLDSVRFEIFMAVSLICALGSIGLLAIMDNNVEMVLAAVLMSGGYGLMCTVCQSTAILRVEPEKRGLGTGTYYVGLNTGMALGPMIGGVLYGNLPLKMFYPVLLLTVPACIVLYWASSKIVSRMK